MYSVLVSMALCNLLYFALHVTSTGAFPKPLSAKQERERLILIKEACAESIYNIVKTEFVFGEVFNDLEELELAWFDYVNWYNNVHIHGGLGHMTPNAYSAVDL